MLTWLPLAFALLLLILIPFAPNLVRLRIRILRWLRWNWAANLLENHFRGWVLLFRIVLFVIAVVLILAAFDPSH